MEPRKIQVFIVKEDSPAYDALMRMVEHQPLQPGRILPVNNKEFESFKEDFIQLEIEEI